MLHKWNVVRPVLLVCCLFAWCGPGVSAQVPANDPVFPLMFESKEALTLLYQRDAEGAMKLADELVAKQPERGMAYVLRAEIHRALGERAAAKADLEKAHGLMTASVLPAYRLSVMASEDGELDAAAAYLEAGRKRDPHNLLLRVGEVNMMITRGKLDEAMSWLRSISTTAIKANLSSRIAQAKSQTHARLGEALVERGNLTRGIAHLELAIIEDTLQTPELYLRLGELNDQAGWLDAARDYYEEFAELPGAAHAPELLKLSKAKLVEMEAKLVARAELEQRNEVLAKEMIEAIDRYRRDPNSTAAYHAAFNLIRPHYDKLLETGSGEMLLRLPKTKPDGLREPADIAELRRAAQPVYRTPEGVRTFPTALVKYPHPLHVHRQAIRSFSGKFPESVSDFAMLAEGVLFAEHYYERSDASRARYTQAYRQLRALARAGRSRANPESATPIEQQLTEMFRLEDRSGYVEADVIRNKLLEEMSADEREEYREILDWTWQIQRKFVEQNYKLKFLLANRRGDEAEAKRLADVLYTRNVQRDDLSAMILQNALKDEDRDRFDTYLPSILSAHPRSPHLWSVLAQDAIAMEDRDAALLLANAAIQFLEEQENPNDGAIATMLDYYREVRTGLEHGMEGDRAAGYWNRAVAYQKAMEAKSKPGYMWKPVVEAAAMRVLEIAPKNATLYGPIAQYRSDMRDFEGAIAAAKLGIEKDKTRPAAVYYQRMAYDYKELLMPSTTDREQLKANHNAAREAFAKCVEAGAMDQARALLESARMYQDAAEYEAAREGYQAVIDSGTTSVHWKAEAHVERGKLAFDHDLADDEQIAADLDAAIKLYNGIPNPTMIDRNRAVSAAYYLQQLRARQQGQQAQ